MLRCKSSVNFNSVHLTEGYRDGVLKNCTFLSAANNGRELIKLANCRRLIKYIRLLFLIRKKNWPQSNQKKSQSWHINY